MTPEQGELVRYRLARAMESLDEARLLFANGHVRTAVNRIYYACFYAVSALLLTKGESSPKHSGVRSLFDQLWIVTGRLPKDMGRFYRRLFDARQKRRLRRLGDFRPGGGPGLAGRGCCFCEADLRDDRSRYGRGAAKPVASDLKISRKSAP